MKDRLLRQLKESRQEREKATLELLKLTRKHIRSVVKKGRGMEADIEDVTQEAMLVLFVALEQEKLRASNDAALVDFIKMTATFIWLNIFKKKGKFSFTDLNLEMSSTEKIILEVLIQLEEESIIHRKLNACLEKLDEICQQIIQWRFREIKKLSWEEIAKRLGYKNAQNAQNKNTRCMKKLKLCMGK